MKISARARTPLGLFVYAQCLAQWPAYSRTPKYTKVPDANSSILMVFFLYMICSLSV